MKTWMAVHPISWPLRIAFWSPPAAVIWAPRSWAGIQKGYLPGAGVIEGERGLAGRDFKDLRLQRRHRDYQSFVDQTLPTPRIAIPTNRPLTTSGDSAIS